MKGGDSGAVAIAGDPAGSPLIEAIRYEHEPKMPPKGKLKDREIEVLTRWVALGLPWPETDAAPRDRGGDERRHPAIDRRAAAVLGVSAGQGRDRPGRPRDVLGPVRRSTAFCWRLSRNKGWHPPRRPTDARCSDGPRST